MDTVGKNETAIRECINNQLKEDIMKGQMSFKEYMDPFTGIKNQQAKKQPRVVDKQ